MLQFIRPFLLCLLAFQAAFPALGQRLPQGLSAVRSVEGVDEYRLDNGLQVLLIPGVVVTCRPIGILKMQDEAGDDAKVLAVPLDKVLAIYTQWQKPEDLNPLRLKTISHFFEHYKDLEPGKWVKVLGWEGPESARQEVLEGIANYRKQHGE